MKTKIKFENGEIKTIIPLRLDIQSVKKYLQEQTGLIYGYGHLYYQSLGLFYAWINFHTPKDPSYGKVFYTTILAMTCGIAENEGGIIAVIEGSKEILVYVPHPSGYHYVYRFHNKFFDLWESHNWAYLHTMEMVKTIEGEFVIDDLNTRLKNALAEENFELAAKLRDEISKNDNQA
jgi:hypothetical protein